MVSSGIIAWATAQARALGRIVAQRGRDGKVANVIADVFPGVIGTPTSDAPSQQFEKIVAGQSSLTQNRGHSPAWQITGVIRHRRMASRALVE